MVSERRAPQHRQMESSALNGGLRSRAVTGSWARRATKARREIVHARRPLVHRRSHSTPRASSVRHIPIRAAPRDGSCEELVADARDVSSRTAGGGSACMAAPASCLVAVIRAVHALATEVPGPDVPMLEPDTDCMDEDASAGWRPCMPSPCIANRPAITATATTKRVESLTCGHETGCARVDQTRGYGPSHASRVAMCLWPSPVMLGAGSTHAHSEVVQRSPGHRCQRPGGRRPIASANLPAASSEPSPVCLPRSLDRASCGHHCRQSPSTAMTRQTRKQASSRNSARRGVANSRHGRCRRASIELPRSCLRWMAGRIGTPSALSTMVHRSSAAAPRSGPERRSVCKCGK